MFTMQEVAEALTLMYVRDPWERVRVRLQSFALARAAYDRDWYPHLLAYAEQVVAEELARLASNGEKDSHV